MCVKRAIAFQVSTSISLQHMLGGEYDLDTRPEQVPDLLSAGPESQLIMQCEADLG